MDYIKMTQSVLLAVLAVLALSSLAVQAQEYLQYDELEDTRGRIPIATVRRYRRQGLPVNIEQPRYRRQGGGGEGVTGPVHTFVKTDEHAHFKWGVRHHVGHEYAGR